MRFRFILILGLLTMATAVSRAQESGSSPRVADEPIPIVDPPGQMIDDLWTPVTLEPLSGPPYPVPTGPMAEPASDFCTSAPELDLSSGFDGGQTLVNAMTESPGDPVLSCVYGTPPRPQGYRTVWYRFVAPRTGRVVVESRPNADYFENYDTVIVIYSGSCASLTRLACGDDQNGFLSRASLPVVTGQTYYVEVADWHFPVNNAARLNLVAWIEGQANFWVEEGTMGFARSRFATATLDQFIYVLGGQSVVSNTPTRVGVTDRYDVTADSWTTLTPMPGPDNAGYSNADAARVNNAIYLPSGYVGDNDAYDGTHWRYDITANQWFSNTLPAPWPVPLGYTALIESPQLDGYFVTGGIDGAPFDAGNAVTENSFYLFRQGIGGLPDAWFTQPDMPIARYYHSGVQLTQPAGWVCVVGGVTTTGAGSFFPANGACFTGSGDWRLIAETNVSRFGAESIIGPDGRWYVVGGYGATSLPVDAIEVFNPPDPLNPGDLGSWTILDSRFDLIDPTRAWARGGAFGQALWVVGGDTTTDAVNFSVVPLVESLRIVPTNLPGTLFLPQMHQFGSGSEPDNTFDLATHVPMGAEAFSNFADEDDRFDVFSFDVTVPALIWVRLDEIPEGNNYDFALYNANKGIIARGTEIGSLPDQVDVNLAPGRYYIMVIRVTSLGSPPPTPNYRLHIASQMPQG